MMHLPLTDLLLTSPRTLVLVAVLGLLAGCGAAKPPPADTTRATTSTAGPDPLLADVARFRPAAGFGTVVVPDEDAAVTSKTTPRDVTVRATAQLDAWAEANRTIKSTPGFRILAYTGPSRDEAMKIRTAVIRRAPDEKDYLQFEQPTFRLKIGDYFTRLEAEAALARFRDVMPRALIVAELVSVR